MAMTVFVLMLSIYITGPVIINNVSENYTELYFR